MDCSSCCIFCNMMPRTGEDHVCTMEHQSGDALMGSGVALKAAYRRVDHNEHPILLKPCDEVWAREKKVAREKKRIKIFHQGCYAGCLKSPFIGDRDAKKQNKPRFLHLLESFKYSACPESI